MARSILNKRNALIGWLTWSVGKRVAKRKARQAVPSVEGGKPNKSAIAAGVAGVTGALLFWRKRRKSDSSTDAAA
jgi:LPXTG-motif cell wall-anchored protein